MMIEGREDFREIRTTRHIYRTKDHLGTGASCEVYFGIEKSTGRKHALKIFRDATWARSEERRREVSALRRLKHPNIVVLLGEEEEVETRRQLLVLELCTEGSLHTHLREPVNSRGLCDSEFLILLKDLSAALHHLHDNNIVHRDIKPGNILRHLDLDGSVIYKLSDFGACRVLSEGDQFMSLAGTEEYLHPLVYEKAFVDRGAVVCFDSSVDFWSVGCSLYQAACGQSPFRPHGGARNNREVMFKMIGQKGPGVIAGHQTSESGDITWETHLPNNSRLSPKLRSHVRNLIACLLETEQTTSNSRDRYQQHVKNILRRVSIPVFNMEELTYIIMYVEPRCGLAEFQEQLAGETEIMAGDQLLYHRGCKLADLTTDGATIDTLSCDHTHPIYLVSKCESDPVLKKPRATDSPPSFQVNSSLEKDVHVAHKMAVVLSDIHEQISNFDDAREMFSNGVTCITHYVEKHMSNLERISSNLSSRSQEVRDRLDLHSDLEDKRIKLTLEPNVTIKQGCRQSISAIQKVRHTLEGEKENLSSCREIINSFSARAYAKSSCSKKCVTKACNLSQKGRDIWGEIYSRKKHQPLSERQQLCHMADRECLEEVLTSLLSLYEGHCLPNYNQLVNEAMYTIENFHSVMRTICEIRRCFSEVKTSLKSVDMSLAQINAFSGLAWNEASKKVNGVHDRPLSDGSMSNSLDKISTQDTLRTRKLKPRMPVETLSIREDREDLDLGYNTASCVPTTSSVPITSSVPSAFSVTIASKGSTPISVPTASCVPNTRNVPRYHVEDKLSTIMGHPVSTLNL